MLRPHIPSAALLSDGPLGVPLAPNNGGTGEAGAGAEVVRLRRELRAQSVEAQLVELRRSGKVIPATEALARALLLADDSQAVTLSEANGEWKTQAVSAAFAAYLAAQPAVVTLRELVPDAAQQGSLYGPAGGAGTLTAAQREWFSQRLGVDPDEVEKTIKAERQAGKKAGK